MTALFLVLIASVVIIAVVVLSPVRASAHCDTLDGPAAQDGRRALETGNPNHALKWIDAGHEGELLEIFTLAKAARAHGQDAQQVADRWFLENLVRIHRAGEGEPYTGLKPSDGSIDEKVLAADRCVETGTLQALDGLMPAERLRQLEAPLATVLAHRNYDVDDLDAGRAYVGAYVSFVKLAEGEEAGGHHVHAGHGH